LDIQGKDLDCKLVIAGGYDPRNAENLEYHIELTSLLLDSHITSETLYPPYDFTTVSSEIKVLFFPSVDDETKESLLTKAKLILYTPPNEHFGIVPLEAMLHKTPVLAMDSGGPIETVVDGKTGWLRPDEVDSWAEVMTNALHADSSELDEMGTEGRKHVMENFSDTSMARQFESVIRNIPTRKTSNANPFLLIIMVAVMTKLFMYIISWQLH